MRFHLQVSSRYRPRCLTLVVIGAVGVLIALANLSVDRGGNEAGFAHASYGWPLVWHRYVIKPDIINMDGRTVGSYYSALRLALDSTIWFVMLAASAGACEWLMRRYRPRLRWSLRAMLAAIALAAAVCAWWAAARYRAELQDQLIAEFSGGWGHYGIRMDRWGPGWLDLLGADRLRRRIVDVDSGRELIAANANDERLLKQLAQLSSLQHLDLNTDRMTFGIAASLNEMRNLRKLRLTHSRNFGGVADDDESEGDDSEGGDKLDADNHEADNHGDAGNGSLPLPPIGKMVQLEELRLDGVTVRDDSLAGLDNLKSICLGDSYRGLYDQRESHECLSAIGKATQVEHLVLVRMGIRDESLSCLAGLVKLKSLHFSGFSTRAPRLVHLPVLPRLEALSLNDFQIHERDLSRLTAMPRLRSLSLIDTGITTAGLSELRSLESLEELRIDDDFVSAAGLDSLRRLTNLKRLHLVRRVTYGRIRYAKLALDGGDDVAVPADELEACRRGLRDLRAALPGIVIDGGEPAGWRWWIRESPWHGYGSQPIHYSTWLHTSGAAWMTPAERTAFDNLGGWARFDAAGWDASDGRATQF